MISTKLKLSVLATERPETQVVLKRYGIEAALAGDMTIEQFCRSGQIDPVNFVWELKAAEVVIREGLAAFKSENPSKVAGYISVNYHRAIPKELSRLDFLGNSSQYLPSHTPEEQDKAQRIYGAFSELKKEILEHLEDEETNVFPAITALEQAMDSGERLDRAEFLTVLDSSFRLDDEHEHVSAITAMLHELTGNYDASATSSEEDLAFYSGLQTFEERLFEHIHIEIHVLRPLVLNLLDEYQQRKSSQEVQFWQ